MLRAGIVGTGLIGASIGRGLSAAGWDVVGWDRDPDALSAAFELGAITRTAPDRDALFAEPFDVIVLAGPPASITQTLASVDVPSLIMDVSGVKASIVEAARPRRFVGTHPMAGREHTGPRASSPALFRGAAWIVATDGADRADLEFVESLIELLGARPVRMTAADHDAAVALVSHVPQLLAGTLLMQAAEREGVMDLAAGSFRDLTRVAASSPEMWSQLLIANRTEVIAVLEDLGDRLAATREELAAGGRDSIHRLLEAGRQLRAALSAPVVAVRVVLRDEPGELARVGRALERSAVDVRDLQLRHAPYGGGGVLTLSVRPGEAAALIEAARFEGLPVEE